MLYGVECLVTAHTSHVKVLVEVALVGIDGLASLLADAIRGEVLLALLGLVLFCGCSGVLQTVEAHLGFHSSEDGCCHVACDAFYLAHGGEPLDAYSVALLQLTVVGLHLVGGVAQGGCCLLLVLCLLSLALGMTFLALLYLGYLAGNLVIIVLGVYLLHLLLEGVELLTDAFGLFFLGLTLTNLSDGILYLFVALLEKFLCLLLCLGENLFATLLDFLDVALILGLRQASSP